MADDVHEVNGDSDEHQQTNEDASQKKSAKHDSGAADLEKVTDYAEEKEIISTEDFKGAMSFIGDIRNKEAAEKMAKERELLKVAINKEDVDLILDQCGVVVFAAKTVVRSMLSFFNMKMTEKKIYFIDTYWVAEFEIARPKAERVLREHLGNVVDALTALTN